MTSLELRESSAVLTLDLTALAGTSERVAKGRAWDRLGKGADFSRRRTVRAGRPRSQL